MSPSPSRPAAAPGPAAPAGAGRPDDQLPLFVYGTLKRGQSNHARLDGARWLGLAALEGLQLYDLGPFPMAIPGVGRVEGELYGLSPRQLPAIDAFEGCPRLYQRRRLPLADGRLVWVYVGHPRQVRHSRLLPGGAWPAPSPLTPSPSPWSWRARRWALAALLLGLPLAGAAIASPFDTTGACQAWQTSRGLARLELGNAIGAAHYLTKRQRLQESTADAPVELYSPADLQRVCGRP